MKRAALFLVFSVLLAAPAGAVGDAVEFSVRVKKIELLDSTGNWFTLAVPEKEVDILAENAALCETKNDGSVPAGSYAGVRITLSETVRFKGFDEQHRTKKGGELEIGGNASKGPDMDRFEVASFRQKAPTHTLAEAEWGAVTQRIDFDFEDRDDVITVVSKRPFRKPLAVKADSLVRVGLAFDTKRAVHYVWKDFFSGIASDEAMYYLPPKDVSEVTVKADSTTALLTSEALEWQF